MEIKYRFWLEKDGKVVFCSGNEELLRGIDELHSLYAATKRLNRSYRSAWGKLRDAEKHLGFKLTESGGPGKRLCLTTEAKAILEKFDMMEHDVASFVNWETLNWGGNMLMTVNTGERADLTSTIIPATIHGAKSSSVPKKRSVGAAS